MLNLTALIPKTRKPPDFVQALPEFESAAGDGWLHRVMAESVHDRLHEKQGRSIARWTLPPLVLFLKRHYRLAWWQGLLARLFPGRAWSPGMQEWEHLKWADAKGFPVPRALAAAEWRSPLQSFLAIEELAGMLPLHEAIPFARKALPPSQFAKWKRFVIRELARLAAKLHGLQAFHKDLYLCHFYVAERHCREVPQSFHGGLVMIDLHRLGRHTLLARYFQVKDLAQLLYSSREVNGVTARDRLRFWKYYRGASWLRFAVMWKVQLYLRHSRRKSARNANG